MGIVKKKLAVAVGVAIAAVLGSANSVPDASAASLTTAPGKLEYSRGVSTYPIQSAIGSARSGVASATAASGSCGVRTDMPHASNTTPWQIHTRAESYCFVLLPSSNSLTATTYRSRWWGWQEQGSKSDEAAKPSVRVTVAIDCKRDDWYRYRTNSRGYFVAFGRSYTAASYEENDSEIRCFNVRW